MLQLAFFQDLVRPICIT